jgi:hypothetical protein
MRISKPHQGHQGDVYLRQVESLPADAEAVGATTDFVVADGAPPPRLERLVLAEGEVTGHAHAVHSGAVMFRADEGLGTYLWTADGGAQVSHEEHARADLLPDAIYEAVIQSQYEPDEIRNVAD